MIAALLAATAAFVWFSADREPRRRLRRFLTIEQRTSQRSLSPTMIRVSCALAGLGCVLLIAGAMGLVLGGGVALLGPVFIAKLEPRADRARSEALVRMAPEVADLLAACVASGASVRDAAQVVADAVEEPMRGALRNIVAAIDLGASGEVAWADAAGELALAPIAHAVMRSEHSGAPLAELLSHIATDVRRERRLQIEVAARAAGVRAVAPLALCFLPAFLLLSVVPIVVDLGGSMLHPQG